MKRPTWRGSVMLLIGSSVFSLVLLEISVRVLRPYNVPPYPVVPEPGAIEFEVFAPHGYRLRPNRTFTAATGWGETWVSNSDGFRERREFAEADKRTRILMVGDSYVFGLGVEQNERFSNLIEAMEPGWRIDNLGMNGYGPDLMLMALEEVGLKTKPDVVVFCLYTDSYARVNPYFTGYGYELPRYVEREGQLIKVPYPKHRIWDSLHAIWWVRHFYHARANPEERLNETILEKFAAMARDHEFTPVFVHVPGHWVATFRPAWLRTAAERLDVPMLDLSGPIHAAGREEAFLPEDIHWNRRGHQIAAETLHHFLAENVLREVQ